MKTFLLKRFLAMASRDDLQGIANNVYGHLVVAPSLPGESTLIRRACLPLRLVGPSRMGSGVSLVCSGLLLAGCNGEVTTTRSSPSSMTNAVEYRSDGSVNTSRERQDAVTEQMIRQGVAREDAEAATKAIYDAERAFQSER